MKNYSKVIADLKSVLRDNHILENEPMSRHTSFKIGGPADLYLYPETESELIKTLDILEKSYIPYYIKGGGNNLLVSDKGYRGAIIDLTQLKELSLKGETITAGCGVRLRDISDLALENALYGYEFASGIPGTIGGAVFMNAGAYGGEHKDVVKSVRFLEDGKIKEISGAEAQFGYRQSIFKKGNKIILSVSLKLLPGEKERIEEKIKDLSQRRMDKQPLNFPSAGSTFKRPKGYFAGKLIDDNGFRGYTLGGAAVSEKHCGFIINKDGATAKDVLDLIHLIQKTVKENDGVVLEPEVIFIGEPIDEANA